MGVVSLLRFAGGGVLPFVEGGGVLGFPAGGRVVFSSAFFVHDSFCDCSFAEALVVGCSCDVAAGFLGTAEDAEEEGVAEEGFVSFLCFSQGFKNWAKVVLAGVGETLGEGLGLLAGRA